MREFAERHDLSTTSLSTWSRRYRDAKPQPAKPQFVELATLPAAVVDDGQFVCEVELAGGHKLRLRRGFDAGELTALVAALR